MVFVGPIALSLDATTRKLSPPDAFRGWSQ